MAATLPTTIASSPASSSAAMTVTTNASSEDADARADLPQEETAPISEGAQDRSKDQVQIASIELIGDRAEPFSRLGDVRGQPPGSRRAHRNFAAAPGSERSGSR